MNSNETEQLIREYQTLHRTKKDAETRLDAIKGTIKAEMAKQDTKVLSANGISIRWRPKEHNCFDTMKFKKENPMLAKQYNVVKLYNYFDVFPTMQGVMPKKSRFTVPWSRKH